MYHRPVTEKIQRGPPKPAKRRFSTAHKIINLDSKRQKIIPAILVPSPLVCESSKEIGKLRLPTREFRTLFESKIIKNWRRMTQTD